MSFHQGNFNQRFGSMGDEAENKFEEVTSEGWIRWGLDRPPLQLGMLPEFIRYTPDYLTSACLVECQGFGRDQVVKFKHTKMASLLEWHEIHPVEIFLWDSANSRFTRQQYDHVLELCRLAPTKQFHDGPEYWAVAADDIEGWES